MRLDDDLEPAPDLAESWDISPDNLTYTFHLRSGVQFQDGKTLTAADVKYSWERACNPDTRSPVAGTYLGDIAGSNDVLNGSAEEISGVTVLDERTLKVTITSPISYFLAKLTYPTAMVVDRENVSSGQWWRDPNGAGPFKLKEWQSDSWVVVERNNRYYGKKAAWNLWNSRC